MRDLVFAAVLCGLLPLAAARPFGGVLLWSWISFMNPHQTLWGFATSMPWAMLVFCTTLVGCVMAGEPRRPAVNAVTALLGLFLICITVTSFTALGPEQMVWAKWEWAAKIILGLLLTAALLTDQRRIHALVWLMVIALGYYGVRGGLFTIITGGSFIVMGPPASIISDRNHLAAALLITIPLMNYLRIHSRHRAVQLGLIGAMGLSVFSVVGSQSRGALLGLAAMGLVFWFRSRNKLTSGTIMAAGIAMAIAFMPDSWWSRMHTIETYQEDASAMGRITIWLASLEIAKANPLTGGGFMAMYSQAVVNTVAPDTMARAAHSIWFEVLGEHGFPTLFVWMSIIAAGAYYSWRITFLARGRPDLAWAADLARMSQVSIVAYLAAGSLLSLAYWDFFWTLMVVQGATYVVARRALRESQVAQVDRADAAAAGWRLRGAPARV
jgi:probable O-glycosylation ligase (exosortase A-associated)